MEPSERAPSRSRHPSRLMGPVTLASVLWVVTLTRFTGNTPPGFGWRPTKSLSCPYCESRSTWLTDHSGRCRGDGLFRWSPCLLCDELLISWNGRHWRCPHDHEADALLCPACSALGPIGRNSKIRCVGRTKHTFTAAPHLCGECEQGYVACLLGNNRGVCEACGTEWQVTE